MQPISAMYSPFWSALCVSRSLANNPCQVVVTAIFEGWGVNIQRFFIYFPTAGWDFDDVVVYMFYVKSRHLCADQSMYRRIKKRDGSVDDTGSQPGSYRRTRHSYVPFHHHYHHHNSGLFRTRLFDQNNSIIKLCCCILKKNVQVQEWQDRFFFHFVHKFSTSSAVRFILSIIDPSLTPVHALDQGQGWTHKSLHDGLWGP